MSRIILIIGGARSGKSSFAQELAVRMGKTVLFVATATAGDDEMQQRIEEHRKARPSSWSTLEVTTNVGAEIAREIGDVGVVIIDCITLLLNNIFNEFGGGEAAFDSRLLEGKVDAEIAGLLERINRLEATFIIVTNEVGLGLVPDNKTGRLYRDLLGRANQVLARQADVVYFMVAGLPVSIKPPGWSLPT